MKLYLSSFELGDDPERLPALYGADRRVGYVPNARDYTSADPARKAARIERDMAGLAALGLVPELLDLSEYFGRRAEFAERLAELAGVWISGGNTFVLRQAMHLSGLDELMPALLGREDFVYGGYSAWCCVLAPDLHALQQVDDPHDRPYPQIGETIWEGLALLPYMVLPHYKSDHPESADIDLEVQYCIDNKTPFVALRDGEVLVLDISAEVSEIPLRPCPCCAEIPAGT